MNPRTDLDSLFRLNRSKLKSVFSQHFPDKEGRIAYSEFTQFCKNAQIHPDLVTMLEVQRLLDRLTHAAQTHKSSLSYSQFEHSLKHLAVAAFHSAIPLEDKQRMLLLHIQAPCLLQYHVALTCTLQSGHTSDSEDSPEVANSRNSLGTSIHTAQTKSSVEKKTLKVTLNLTSANIKSPSHSLHTQKYFSMSPDPDLQESLSLLTRQTEGNAPRPELSPPASAHSAHVRVKLAISPRKKTSKVPLFHVTLDKQKIQSSSKEAVLVGCDSLPSPHCEEMATASECPIPPIPQTTKGLGSFPLLEVREKVEELKGKFEGWKEFQPKVIGRPLRTVLRKQREFIEETTANWFPGVSAI